MSTLKNNSPKGIKEIRRETKTQSNAFVFIFPSFKSKKDIQRLVKTCQHSFWLTAALQRTIKLLIAQAVIILFVGSKNNFRPKRKD